MGVLRPCSGGRKRGPRVVSRETLVTRSLKRAGHERFFSWHRFGYDADLCASRSWPISLRIVPDGPSGRRDDFGAILSLRAKIGISLRVRRDCVTSNGEAGRRWRAEVACRGWRVGPATLVDGRNRISPRPSRRPESLGTARQDRHGPRRRIILLAIRRRHPALSAAHRTSSPFTSRQSTSSQRTSGGAAHCAGEASAAHVTATAGEHQANGAG